VISYKDATQKIDDLFWTFSPLGSNNGDNQLDAREQFQITIGNATATQNGGNLADALSTCHLGRDTKFSIEIKTPGGSTMVFERTTPSWIDRVMNLDANSGVNLSVNHISATTVTFTATVSPAVPGGGIPTGTIQFYIDSVTYGTPVSLVGGSATSAPDGSLSVGSHAITAVYSGDNNFSGSTSGIFTQTVVQASTTTSLASSRNPSTSGQSVTFTATVSPIPDGGTVQLRITAPTWQYGYRKCSGQATYSTTALTVGNHPITAVYSGIPSSHPAPQTALAKL